MNFSVIHKKGIKSHTNLVNLESQKTQNFTNCIKSRNHDIGCNCITCKACREDLIDFYKRKKKKELITKSFNSVSNSLPIKKNLLEQNNNYMIFNSLPNMYEKKIFEKKNIILKDDKCLLCNKVNSKKIINNFYLLCEKCYITNELL